MFWLSDFVLTENLKTCCLSGGAAETRRNKKNTKKLKSLDEVDPELLKTFEKLGISLEEQKRLTGVAVDIVVDSVSVATYRAPP